MKIPFIHKQSPVSIKRECYAMVSKGGAEAEITMYGQIVETRPKNFWTDEEETGNFIIKDEFLDDLKQIENAKQLTIRLDSLGGNACASLLIYNRLRELKAKKIVQVDGAAMSGGSVIMCAGDTVKVNTGSLIMVHKCAALLFGMYNSADLSKIQQGNDVIDKALASVYSKKTGKTEEEMLALMAEETYMTGDDAVAKGFADELIENEDAPQIAASADHRTLFVNGRALACTGYSLPETIPLAQVPSIPTPGEPAEDSGKGGQEIMARNLEELKQENPELAESMMAEARAQAAADTAVVAAAERLRLQEIDSIASVYDDAIVTEAKYGTSPCTAQELAFRAAQKAALSGKAFLQDLAQDGQASNAGQVPAAAADPELPGEKPLTPKERTAQGALIAKAAAGK